MDWKRTTNILIVILLILNVILYLNIRPNLSEASSMDRYETITGIYNDNEISTEHIEYMTYNKLSKFRISSMDMNDLRDRLFDAGYEVQYDKDSISVYTRSEESQITLTYEGFLEVLKDYGALKQILDIPQEDHHFIILNQTYNGFIFEDGYATMNIIDGRVHSAKFKLLDIQPLGETFTESVFSIENALLALLNESEIAGETDNDIINFEIVYTLNTDDNPLLEEVSSGQPSPMWRALLSDGRVLRVNGLR